MGPKQIFPLWGRIDLGAMTNEGVLHTHNQIQFSVKPKIYFGGVFPAAGDTVSVLLVPPRRLR